MTYRGVITNGNIVFDGAKPAEGAVVDVIVVETLPSPTTAAPPQNQFKSVADHPAFGIWRDRPEFADGAKASLEIRRRMERGE